jgi:pentatricopeptide repeat domain-containing protein 1
VQDRTYLGLLEASGPQVAAWMRSSSFTAMMASLFPPLPDAAALQQPHIVKQLELAAQKDCQLAFEAVRRFEASHNLQLQNMGMSFLQQRGALVGSILQKGGQLRLPDEVVHDAVLLLDRAGSTGVQVGACAGQQS